MPPAVRRRLPAAGAAAGDVLFLDAKIPDEQDKKHEEAYQEQVFQALRLKNIHVRIAFHISPARGPSYEATAGSWALWNTGILVTIQRNTHISVKMIISVITISIQLG